MASKKPAASPSGAKQPNILVIWGDDIGIANLSCYTHGLMGYQTPNIDRLAREGMKFTDSYGEQSCTAGRSSFITGQSVYRTGLSKVGIPAAPIGMSDKIVTIAALLKNRGYATGQFGKNHLGDRNEMLPTNHGFDEFFGNLYHLNAEEEPEMYDYYPEKDFPNFKKKNGPRGVIHSYATDKDDATEQPRWGRVGKQKIEDTGPLTKKRMETCDDEFAEAAKGFIGKQHEAGKPFFVWLNFTHMHMFTHTKPESLGQAGRWQSPYHDTMIDHDKNVGQLLDYLDELGITEDTFVMYSTDNGPHMNSWPDGAMTPFRSEKNTNWEGAFRIPMVVRWPGHVPAGSISNGIVQHHDWLPTFLEMAGEPDIVEKCKKGVQAIGRTYKNHIDGVSLFGHITGKEKESPRKLFVYISDDGDILGLRYDNWKVVFMEQRLPGTMAVWAEPFVRLRLPKLFNLRTDPFERADTTSNSYYEWFLYHAYILYGAYAIADQFAATFKDFPPVQKPNTFTIDDALSKMAEASAGGAT
ncbi:arylsulfatase [Variovorax sp. J22P271]|uniref:arylsulfatase n=1 Tax=Variovorax davisae TaxID=3053515 RepID=UPI002577AB49|nr:arylsulfatase [Variovorax sp. J22P271]MDM0034714.1 arylsulfatase [Variovorax sp. J22P271]